MDARLDRVARNETVFRAVNREIEHASEELGDRELEVLCECGSTGCRGLVAVSADVYDSVHERRDRFLVLPGHEHPEIETVIERSEGYVIVDKFGDAEKIAEEEHDPGPR